MARDSEITTTTEKNRDNEGMDVWDVAAAGLGAAAGAAAGRFANKRMRARASKYKKSKFGSYRDEGRRLSRRAAAGTATSAALGAGVGALATRNRK